MKIVLFSILFFSPFYLYSQTIIINEVSNGPSGNKEYIELVVVDTTAFYSCGNTIPPCIDIRGWIIDDNSGYHGGGGIAAGANRFSQDLLWSCVPLGTIILIYNDADVNANIPPIDLTLNDGNCNIIAPITNTSLFETNTTTPGAIACSYPPTGWVPGGDWASTLLANSGDCARIVNLNGCEVFSLCWASCSTNNMIYFNSTMSGTDNVWYFNDGDPSQQINWSEGCTDPSSCSTDEQTPGAPNNFLNQNYIAQFNNNCLPITPISVTATSTDAGCTCDGSAEANATGSIPGYSYVWYDQNYLNVIGTGFSVSGLCAGTYHVIANSSIECSDTASVIISSNGSLPVAIPVTNSPVCEGDTIELFSNSILNANYQWTGPDNFSSALPNPIITNSSSVNEGNYTLIISDGACSSLPVSVFVDVKELPDISASSNSPLCIGDTLFLFSNSSNAVIFNWSGPLLFSSSSQNEQIINVDTDNVGVYTVVAELNGCFDSAQISVSVLNPASSVITQPSSVCVNNGTLDLTATPSSGTWAGNGIIDFVNGIFDPAAAGAGTHQIIYSFSNNCISNDTILITVHNLPVADAGIDTIIYCYFSSLLLEGTNSSGVGLFYNWTEIFGNIISGDQTSQPQISTPGLYELTITDANGCSDKDTVEITFISGPVASFSTNPNTGYYPLQVSVDNNSIGSNLNYEWITCENDFFAVTEPDFILDSAGVCPILLIVTDENNCIDSAINYVTVYAPYFVYVPNIFTPNSDNENDLFSLTLEGISEMKMSIYNRWGQILFETESLSHHWDGNYQNEPSPEGTYYYLLDLTLPDLTHEQRSGFFTLMR